MNSNQSLVIRLSSQLNVMQQLGSSLHEMSRIVRKIRTVCRNYINDPLNYGRKSKEQKGRPRKVTARDERNILHMVSNSPKSLNEVRGELNLNVCKSTIRNVIKRSGIIVRQKMVKVPKMKPHHKTARLDFVKANLTNKWEKIMFSDEKKWNLDGPDVFKTELRWWYIDGLDWFLRWREDGTAIHQYQRKFQLVPTDASSSDRAFLPKPTSNPYFPTR
uniref:Transposase Tc1-like domain-containing protein n=1 Tax=Caenorhabditis japonica TaxID=281687 RepID=A0A8R1IPG3_CAEJA